MASSSVALHQRILAKACPDPQMTSLLLQKLPPEIRYEIFSYALTDYPDPDPDRAYGTSTLYTRPSYLAPRKSDTALLQTCRAIYLECWFLPFLLREQVHWVVGNQHRAPPGYRFHEQLAKLAFSLHTIRAQQQRDFEIERLHVFAQMFMIEGGHLHKLLTTPELRPRVVTLTIRHADWWFWENDEPLRFEGEWIKVVSGSVPSSVGEIRIELESLERKKSQVDEIARQMKDKWSFRRTDGEVLFAAESAVSRWRGTSRWGQQRWIRDETSEGVIDYYIVTVVFRPDAVLQRRQLEVSATAREYAERSMMVESDQLKLHNPEWSRIATDTAFLHEPQPESESDQESEEDITPRPGGWLDRLRRVRFGLWAR
ncbi:unnamed protein product [Clonostachys byssicola]|uniref:Uncharacterized protein n=1 Tax=Clonostachys byssicola TaxID=160290 RepID=A0A9N9UW51_9HYPO|nr:unnamed protein product [Clonostachys byssicola]